MNGLDICLHWPFGKPPVPKTAFTASTWMTDTSFGPVRKIYNMRRKILVLFTCAHERPVLIVERPVGPVLVATPRDPDTPEFGDFIHKGAGDVGERVPG